MSASLICTRRTCSYRYAPLAAWQSVGQQFFSALTIFIVMGFSALASAQVTLNCSSDYQISHTFSNGAKWDMCWERLDREGLVYSDVYYTTPAGLARRVLNSVALAQIHVPYDDNGARYHDVSDFGLGKPEYLNDLQAADCPHGTRLQEANKNVICRTVYSDEVSALTNSVATPAEILSVFSVSHVGAYNYIPEYRFYDTGVIEPVMGATGKLQRYGSNTAEGWVVRSGGTPVGISHLHNYYWRLDFDLGANGNDDVFEEIEFIAENGNNTSFTKSVTAYNTEVARSINPDTRRFWRVRDNTETNSEGTPVSYDILPLNTGHRDTGPSNEPWTYDDLYLTRHRACERFISHNPSDPDGCSSNADVTDFINGESLVNEDLVVWFGITFHHIPRDEDEPRMHAHWNQFRLVPRDWTFESVNNINFPPVVTNPGDQNSLEGSAVNLPIQASDNNGHAISYSQSGLPAGLGIAANSGLISGTLTAALGTYLVTITATDQEGANTDIQFYWHVDTTPYGACESLTSTDVPKAISSVGTDSVQSTLSVTLGGTVSSMVVTNLSGPHSYMGDLTFTLTNPAGTSVQIIAPACGGNNDFDVHLDDAAFSALPCPPVGGGAHLPSNPLAAFYDQVAAGSWTLTIDDNADADGGSLDSWGLDLCSGNGGAPSTFWHEGFEGLHGWGQNPLANDTGTEGQWSAGNPEQTISASEVMQPEDSAQGLKALVTNPNSGTDSGSNDVDGGLVSAKSPLIALPASGDLALSYQYFFAHRDNSSNDDYFRLSLVDSNNITLQVLTEEFASAVNRPGSWTSVSNIDLNAYRGQSVAFVVEAADEATSSLVEAGLDAMHITYVEADADADGIPDANDNCPSTANNDQLDSDADGSGDVCDPYPLDPNNDIDGDGVSGHIDNCPNTANPSQANADGDGQGDVCDPFPNDPDNDFDGDGISGEIDNCPLHSNSDQLDTDGDTFGDACDEDDDNDKLSDAEELQYGTNALMADTDQDSLSDYDEVYTYATNPLAVDTDGDGYSDAEEIAVGRNPNVFDAHIPLPWWSVGLLGLLLVGAHRLRARLA